MFRDTLVVLCILSVSVRGGRGSSIMESNEARLRHGTPAPAGSPTISTSHRRPSKRALERDHFSSSIIAGVGSGSLASVVCAPLDLVRTRLQVAGAIENKVSQPPKILKSLHEIYLSDGVRGCFRGLGATLATVPLFWGMYFPMYETFKSRIMDATRDGGDDDGGNNHKALVHLSSAISAGAIADVICNPLFVIRVRMQTEALHYLEQAPSERKPHNALTTMRGLYSEGGIPIFWRGLTASLLGLGHVGIQFPVYERLKMEARKRSPTGQESPVDLLLASGISKMTAAILTYPHEVIRSRMMDSRSATSMGVLDTARYIVRHEGYAGLYSGMKVTLFRVVPNCCVTFVSYELIARWVRREMKRIRNEEYDDI